MGSGTTLFACYKMGRHSIGCDTDKDSIDTAQKIWGEDYAQSK